MRSNGYLFATTLLCVATAAVQAGPTVSGQRGPRGNGWVRVDGQYGSAAAARAPRGSAAAILGVNGAARVGVRSADGQVGAVAGRNRAGGVAAAGRRRDGAAAAGIRTAAGGRAGAVRGPEGSRAAGYRTAAGEAQVAWENLRTGGRGRAVHGTGEREAAAWTDGTHHAWGFRGPEHQRARVTGPNGTAVAARDRFGARVRVNGQSGFAWGHQGEDRTTVLAGHEDHGLYRGVQVDGQWTVQRLEQGGWSDITSR